MVQPEIIVRVRMDEKTFRRFSFFDSFHLRKRWRSPVIFAVIMLVAAVICFLLQKNESFMLGSVLAVVGIGLPIVWIGSFWSSVRLQALRLGLDKPKAAYTVKIGSLLRIENDLKKEAAQEVAWSNVLGVWRGKGASYLYVTAAKAFILPDGQADASPAEVWNALAAHAGEQKMHGAIK